MLSVDLGEVSVSVLPGNNRNEIEMQFLESDTVEVEACTDQLESIVPPDIDIDMDMDVDRNGFHAHDIDDEEAANHGGVETVAVANRTEETPPTPVQLNGHQGNDNNKGEPNAPTQISVCLCLFMHMVCVLIPPRLLISITSFLFRSTLH